MMVKNEAYLKSSSSPESDECLTPRYAVEPIVKYLKAKKFNLIWCPFDKKDSQFVRVLEREGFDVISTHISETHGLADFFDASDYHKKRPPIYPKHDCIVSNPPFSLKDKILEELYSLGIPFMMLLPQNSLQSVARVDMYMEHGLEYLGFDKRICFYTNKSEIKEEYDAETRSYIQKKVYLNEMDLTKFKTSNHFSSGYFCHNVLPEKLMFEKLDVVQEPYSSEHPKVTS